MRVLLKAIAWNFCAYVTRPFELGLSLLAAVLNNLLFVYGIYLMASLSASADGNLRQPFLIMSGVLVTAWGMVNLLLGGLDDLGDYIACGKFDAFLATPQHPLLLMATFNNSLAIMGLAELLQGLAVISYLGYQQGGLLAIKLLLAVIPSAIALLSTLIIAGTSAFFVQSGNHLAFALSRLLMFMSLFPVSALLNGKERILIYVTPILMTAHLPLQYINTGNIIWLVLALSSSLLLLLGALALFNLGRRRYQTANWIGI